ncbi:MAG TPA: ABC transporter permease [Acidimicrobiales bacterium]|nr:ABC transporter permease [Acidimicrobiales bacterium]
MISTPAVQARPSLKLILTSLLRADCTVLVKNRRSLVISIALPLVLLLTTNSTKGTSHLGGAYYVIGLCTAYGLAATSILGYALTVARDREKGVFQRLRVTPAPTWAIMGSRLAVQVVANLIIALVVLIVGSSLHNLTLSVGQYVLFLLVSVLGGAVFLGIGQAMVGLLKSADTVNAAARIVFIALIFLGLFGQSGVLGTAWESISKWTPVGVVMTLFAGVLNLSSWGSRESLAVLSCIGYTVFFAAIGIRWFQWEAR